jgi:hypothetical protein
MKSRFFAMLGTATLAMLIPLTAAASLKKEGVWPTTDKTISLEFDGKPSDGLKELAKAAGWSLVVRDGATIDGKDVHVDVDDQPADVVLDALFSGGQDVVADRNGSLVTLRPSTGTPSNTAAPLAAPAVRGEDRNVFGGTLVVAKGETVHTVTVAGGSLRVEGTVTGDLVVAGGSATVVSGAHVFGNASALGGSLKIENDARVDGDVGVVGGSLTREEGAIIGGKVVDEDHPGDVKVNVHGSEVATSVVKSDEPRRSRFSTAAHTVGESMTKMALLFVFGCVLLSLLTNRMEKVQAAIASRPMHSFATGVVTSIVGGIGSVVLLVALCVSIIGIPVAIAAVLLGVFTLYAGIASVLTTIGAALVAHRSNNPYVHLLVGCTLFLALSLVPWVGGIVTFAVVMVAVGVLVTTRGGAKLATAR